LQQRGGADARIRTPPRWTEEPLKSRRSREHRVDLKKPTFSNPTRITNPLFPISQLKSVVLLGKVDGKPFRSETTLLPRTGTVTWEGQPIRVALSQYAAYLDGRLEEVAIDRYAQADDGSVWYLGEDVFDYRNGAVAITEGTWLVGRDGPAAMIMPGKPKVGDVYRAENVIGVVFEELTVKSVTTTRDGPRGPVRNIMVADELHLDESISKKYFAPGYGEFFSGKGPDVEALAVAVPTDALATSMPVELRFLSTAAWGILENARLEDWEAADSTVARMNGAWAKFRTANPPPLIAARMKVALGDLTKAVKTRQGGSVAQAAVDAGQAALDLQLRHRPVAEIDTGRMHLWSQQLRVHAAAKDLAGVTGAVAVLEWMRDRIVHTLDPAERQEIDSRLHALRGAADAKNLGSAADRAALLTSRLRSLVAPAASGPPGR